MTTIEEWLVEESVEDQLKRVTEARDFLMALHEGPRCHICGRYAGDMVDYLCGGCLRLPEHCNCKTSQLTTPIEWKPIK